MTIYPFIKIVLLMKGMITAEKRFFPKWDIIYRERWELILVNEFYATQGIIFA